MTLVFCPHKHMSLRIYYWNPETKGDYRTWEKCTLLAVVSGVSLYLCQDIPYTKPRKIVCRCLAYLHAEIMECKREFGAN